MGFSTWWEERPPAQSAPFTASCLLTHLFLLTAKKTLHKLGSSSPGLTGNHPQTQVFRHQLKKGDSLQSYAPQTHRPTSLFTRSTAFRNVHKYPLDRKYGCFSQAFWNSNVGATQRSTQNQKLMYSNPWSSIRNLEPCTGSRSQKGHFIPGWES